MYAEKSIVSIGGCAGTVTMHTSIDPSARWSFVVYTSVHAPFSSLAVANLRTLCEAYLSGRHHIREVNLDLAPEAAREHGIETVPTVVRLRPGPVLKTADCRHLGVLRSVLGLDVGAACSP